jgi:hypothetical protein
LSLTLSTFVYGANQSISIAINRYPNALSIVEDAD